MRLDLYLTENNPDLSRTRAANLVELGRVKVNGKVVLKQAYDVKDGDEVRIESDYEASLGGIKLKSAFESFRLNVNGKICLDVGAANGGFTDILLRNGAKTVYALDVGECALPEYLKQDERVKIMDKTNARYITREDFDLTPGFVVIDVSFISLTLIIGSVMKCLGEHGEIVALIKPQFECSKKDLTKRGLLLDEKRRKAVVEKIKAYCEGLGLKVEGVISAPHPFENKNQEYLIYLKF